jgi:ATP-dependent helicase HrpB
MIPALPIDPFLPQLTAMLREHQSVVLVAEPGAGKTTRVPPALHQQWLEGNGKVLVLEPRRVAAKLAAQRVASEQQEQVGGKIGYHVRFEKQSSEDTQLYFMTEGVAFRQAIFGLPFDEFAVVIFDEFHERHLEGDLLLALMRRLQQSRRPELRLVVMSATVELEPLAAYLKAPVLRVPGRLHAVAVEFAPRPDRRPLAEQVATALTRLRRRQQTDHVLVFLPGAADLRRCREACGKSSPGLDFHSLHGGQPLTEQMRAIAPSQTPKVIFSTNVAETSVTIDGVGTVIDSGLARQAGHSPWSGLPSLVVGPISQASAIQRAGRAGRTKAGRCLRLFTAEDFNGRRAFEQPEICRTDLAEAMLLLAAAKGPQLVDLSLPSEPPPAALAAANELLSRLGAIDGEGHVTTLGHQMARLPLHPRLARLVVAAAEAGHGREGCRLAALLAERDIRLQRRPVLSPRAKPTGPEATEVDDADGLTLLALYGEAEAGHFAPDRTNRLGLDRGTVRRVAQSVRRLETALGRTKPVLSPTDDGQVQPLPPPQAPDPQPLLQATLAAFPDRLARRRRPGGQEVVLARGGAARLAPSSVVQAAEYLVAVEAHEETRGRVVIHHASAVEPDWLLELFPERVHATVEVNFSSEKERVEAVERLCYDELVLDETQAHIDPYDAEVSRTLAEAARAAGWDKWSDQQEREQLEARLAFAAEHLDGLPPPDEALWDRALMELCTGCSSFEQLRHRSLVDAVTAQYDPQLLARAWALAPTHVALPGRRRAPVSYHRRQPPSIASPMQDFFGLHQGPTVADGRVPLVLHLLGPHQRDLQVTTDLGGFWERHYPALRRQLMRRYPKHFWPEEPLQAPAQRLTHRKRRG